MNIMEFMHHYHDTYINYDNRLFKLKLELVPFDNICKKEVLEILNQLSKNEAAMFSLMEMGIAENEQLEKFALCNMANHIDIQIKQIDCEERGRCPGNGFVCKTAGNKN